MARGGRDAGGEAVHAGALGCAAVCLAALPWLSYASFLALPPLLLAAVVSLVAGIAAVRAHDGPRDVPWWLHGTFAVTALGWSAALASAATSFVVDEPGSALWAAAFSAAAVGVYGLPVLLIPWRSGAGPGWPAIVPAFATAALVLAGAWTLDPGALPYAAGAGREGAVRWLLMAGQDPDRQDDSGHTALTHAAAYGHAGVVGALLDAGADPDVVENAGYTALAIAARHGDPATVARLLEAGADVDGALDRRPELQRGPEVAPIAEAAAACHADIVATLRAHGAAPVDPAVRAAHCDDRSP